MALPAQGAEGVMLVGSAGAQQLQQLWSQATVASGCSEGELELPGAYGRLLWVPKAVMPTSNTPLTNNNTPSTPSGSSLGSRAAATASTAASTSGTAAKVPGLVPAAYFTFEQLCGPQGLRKGIDQGGALSAPDYLVICR